MINVRIKTSTGVCQSKIVNATDTVAEILRGLGLNASAFATICVDGTYLNPEQDDVNVSLVDLGIDPNTEDTVSITAVSRMYGA